MTIILHGAGPDAPADEFLDVGGGHGVGGAGGAGELDAEEGDVVADGDLPNPSVAWR